MKLFAEEAEKWNFAAGAKYLCKIRIADISALIEPHSCALQVGNLANGLFPVYLVVNNKIVGKFVTVLYTPGQLRSAVSIAPETYRHWKKALRPLQCARGHSPCFKPGDLVALTIIRLLTQDMGIRVGTLAPIGDALFDICNRSPWPILERSKLIIDLPDASLLLCGELAETPTNKPFITIPLAPIVAHLSEQLLTASNEDEQQSLHFPPVKIASSATRGGRP